jgi:GT2 family glycosyltransferase
MPDAFYPLTEVSTSSSPERAKAARPRRQRVTQPAWVQSILDDGPIDVTVCIANWNCRELLRACLESLHDQPQGLRLETVVVDNASADGAPEMVARDFPEVVLVRNRTNLGFSRANNQAASRSRGRYLLFLNNDTVVPANALAPLVDFLEAHPDVGLLGPRLRDPGGRTQVSYRQLPTLAALLHRTYLLRWTGLFRFAYRSYRREHFDPTRTQRVPVLMGAAVLLPRHVFDECGGWDEDYTFGGEDIDLSARVGRRYQVVYHPHIEITHHGRVSTRLNASYSLPNVAVGYVRYLRKSGASPAALLLYKLAITLDTPLHLAVKTLQYVMRRLRGRPWSAEKSLLAARGLWHFLRHGIRTFWKA